MNPNIKFNDDGSVVEYAWPRGYPVYYITKDGSILSSRALRDNLHLVNNPRNPQWYAVACVINWKDDDLYCDDSGEKIPCAYPPD